MTTWQNKFFHPIKEFSPTETQMIFFIINKMNGFQSKKKLLFSQKLKKMCVKANGMNAKKENEIKNRIIFTKFICWN